MAEQNSPAPKDAPATTPETDTPLPPEERDWKADFETLKANYDTLEGKSKSVQTSLNRAHEEAANFGQLRDDFEDLRAEVSGMPEVLTAGFEAMSSGESGDIKGALATARGKAQSQRAETLFKSKFDGIRRRMDGVIESMPEEVRIKLTGQWSEAIANQKGTDLEPFRDMLESARDLKQKAELAAKDTLIEEGATKLKGARAEFEKEYEVNDLSTGSASPGGTGEAATKDNIDALYMEKPEKYADQYRTFLRTGQLS